jgi:protein-tyrosine-phosphatase
MPFVLVVFVCVSNTCRSPMAEYICRQKLQKIGLENQIQVISRSLCTDYEPENSPASPQGVQVLLRLYGF